MTLDCGNHVISINSFLSGKSPAELDFWARDELQDLLSEEFYEVEKLENHEYKVELENGDIAHIDYQVDTSIEGDSEFSTEIYGAETAVVKANNYLDSKIKADSAS